MVEFKNNYTHRNYILGLKNPQEFFEIDLLEVVENKGKINMPIPLLVGLQNLPKRQYLFQQFNVKNLIT